MNLALSIAGIVIAVLAAAAVLLLLAGGAVGQWELLLLCVLAVGSIVYLVRRLLKAESAPPA